MNNDTDIFEKIFGEKPDNGYIFNSIDFSFGISSVVISWSAQGIGFGELVFGFSKDGLFVDTAMMGNDFVFSCIDETIRRIDEGQKASASVKVPKLVQKFYETLDTIQTEMYNFLRQKNYQQDRKNKKKFFLEGISSIEQYLYIFLHQKEYYQFGGYKRIDSKEGNEPTIKSVLLFFKNELVEKPNLNKE